MPNAARANGEFWPRLLGRWKVEGARLPGAGRVARRVAVGRKYAANLRNWAQQEPTEVYARLDLALALAEPPVTPLLLPGGRTLHSCSKPGTPRGVICSLATGTHISLLSVAAPTLIDYGEKHGWDVVLSTEESLADGRAISWAKLPLIRELLTKYDLVWWIDADALIVDSSRDIRCELRDGKDLYLVEHWFPHPHAFVASAGIMLWRSSAQSLKLIDDLWSRREHAQIYPWENAALLDALGYISSPVFMHLHPSPYVLQMQLLGPEWNSVYSDPAEHPRIHHHGGDIALAERRRLMLEDLARVRRGQEPQMNSDGAWPHLNRNDGRLLLSERPAASMTRDDLPALLNERGLNAVAVEIGVYAGEFSARLLRSWNGRRLISVDPWLWAPDYLDVSNVDQPGYELLYEATRVRLARFGSRSDIWRMTSEQAAMKVDDASVDFVYIDARHDEASVQEDLALWIPKVRPGGIIAGHDYLDGELPEGSFGVKRAVDNTFAALSLPVAVTGEEAFPTWIVELPPSGVTAEGIRTALAPTKRPHPPSR